MTVPKKQIVETPKCDHKNQWIDPQNTKDVYCKDCGETVRANVTANVNGSANLKV